VPPVVETKEEQPAKASTV
jgi:serine/threonine protein phosphatase PrpC